MNNPEESSRSKCSATDPANEFSMGITAAATAPDFAFANTSAEDTHGTTVARGSIRRAASWLKEPSSPWMATLIASLNVTGQHPDRSSRFSAQVALPQAQHPRYAAHNRAATPEF